MISTDNNNTTSNIKNNDDNSTKNNNHNPETHEPTKTPRKKLDLDLTFKPPKTSGPVLNIEQP